MAFFGVLSMLVAMPFMLVQGEYKRLLAYSSIEHTGFVALAIGLGTPLAVFGGMLHLLMQSLAKTLAFLAGGTIGRAANSRRLDHWSGVLAVNPALGTLFIFAGLGLAGLPPTGTFVSEWLALAGGFAGPRPTYAILAGDVRRGVRGAGVPLDACRPGPRAAALAGSLGARVAGAAVGAARAARPVRPVPAAAGARAGRAGREGGATMTGPASGDLFPLDTALRGIRERFSDAVIDADRTSLRERTVVVPADRLAEVAGAVASEWGGTLVALFGLTLPDPRHVG